MPRWAGIPIGLTENFRIQTHRSNHALATFRRDRRLLYDFLSTRMRDDELRIWKQPVAESAAESVLSRTDSRNRIADTYPLDPVNYPEQFDNAKSRFRGAERDRFVGSFKPPPVMSHAEWKEKSYDSAANVQYNRLRHVTFPMPQVGPRQMFSMFYKPGWQKSWYEASDPGRPFTDASRGPATWWWGLLPGTQFYHSNFARYRLQYGSRGGTGDQWAGRRNRVHGQSPF
eukprot:TRINITY_DN4818_c0_g1_i1.p2 TRINITY_DN4818_c0_g1~~TRINITY_DN4818_c0_g1_i1.p2  ORF type:complete len:229 (+),score=6.41 TRINITY_DN4818_c0_g1_i1:82-768(+)